MATVLIRYEPQTHYIDPFKIAFEMGLARRHQRPDRRPGVDQTSKRSEDFWPTGGNHRSTEQPFTLNLLIARGFSIVI